MLRMGRNADAGTKADFTRRTECRCVRTEPNNEESSRRRGGETIPFTTAHLMQLYPTHDDYVTKYTAAADQALAAGYLLQADHDDAIAQAKAAAIPPWRRRGAVGSKSSSLLNIALVGTIL
jgi:hypothetical protein